MHVHDVHEAQFNTKVYVWRMSLSLNPQLQAIGFCISSTSSNDIGMVLHIGRNSQHNKSLAPLAGPVHMQPGHPQSLRNTSASSGHSSLSRSSSFEGSWREPQSIAHFAIPLLAINVCLSFGYPSVLYQVKRLQYRISLKQFLCQFPASSSHITTSWAKWEARQIPTAMLWSYNTDYQSPMLKTFVCLPHGRCRWSTEPDSMTKFPSFNRKWRW